MTVFPDPAELLNWSQLCIGPLQCWSQNLRWQCWSRWPHMNKIASVVTFGTPNPKSNGSSYQYMGLSENSVPLHPMVNDHYPYLNGYNWGYTPFSDIPIFHHYFSNFANPNSLWQKCQSAMGLHGLIPKWPLQIPRSEQSQGSHNAHWKLKNTPSMALII